MKLGVNLVLSDEPPLFLERVEVLGRFLAIFLMHQQKGIESLKLHPPFFALVFGLSECCAFLVKAAHVGVPSIGQRMINQHSCHLLGPRIVRHPEHIFCFEH